LKLELSLTKRHFINYNPFSINKNIKELTKIKTLVQNR